MAKHIRIEGASLAQHNKVLVKVTAQTHVGRAFGNDWLDSRKFVASNGFTLASNRYPANDTDNPNIFWVQGTGDAKQQSTTVVMSRTKFNKVLVAADEYNKAFAVCAAPASCVQIVG